MKPELDQLAASNIYQIQHSVLGAIHQKAFVDDVEYEWCGGFGAVLKSRERGIKKGEIRMVLGIPFHVFAVHRHAQWFWEKPEVCWTIPSAYSSAEWIREFKSVFFSA